MRRIKMIKTQDIKMIKTQDDVVSFLRKIHKRDGFFKDHPDSTPGELLYYHFCRNIILDNLDVILLRIWKLTFDRVFQKVYIEERGNSFTFPQMLLDIVEINIGINNDPLDMWQETLDVLETAFPELENEINTLINDRYGIKAPVAV